VCRFLDAGNDERPLALGRPASKKRQGTKSRKVGHWLSSERYGDLILAPAVTWARCWQKATWMSVGRGAWERATGISVVAWTAPTGNRLVDRRDWAERDRRRRGASASEQQIRERL
jgi:hypothetical protein